jgi:hypothetical protein
MWAVLAVAVMVALRDRIGLRPRTWLMVHTGLVLVIVVGTIVHAVLVQGTMEIVTKIVLCALLVIATPKVVADLQVWRQGKRGPTARGDPEDDIP